MTNKSNTGLHTGVTNDLKRRTYQHREHPVNGFTRRYRVERLVYYEVFDDPENAILREKQIKSGSRKKKIDLVNSCNSEWQDLYDEI